MVNKKARDVSRRHVMKMGLTFGAGAALGGLLPPGSARAQQTTLDWWWWGEQELPGLQKFVDSSVAAYKEATVKPMLQDTAVVISQFQTAAAAGNAPDIQYLWNRMYHMESVWLGYLKGLKELIKPEILTASNPTQARQFRRRYLSRRLVSVADALDLQQEAVRTGRARPERTAQDVEELLAACEKLKAAGIEPLGGGIQDGYWSEWYISPHCPEPQLAWRSSRALHRRQGLSPTRSTTSTGSNLEELKTRGYLNKDMSSLELYPGIDLVDGR